MEMRSKVIQKLEERHQIYAGLNREEVAKDPFWRNKNPMKENEINEWIEYGVNTIMSEMGCDRTKAEIEMSWIEASYMTTIK
jgi:hypothetical protein